MAEQGYVLDIDTKFLQNLEKADKHLKMTISSSNGLTTMFTNMVGSSGSFLNKINEVKSKLISLGNVKIDSKGGFEVMTTSARTSIDAVNLLRQNLNVLNKEYRSIAESRKIAGSSQMKMFVNKKDLNDIGKLKKGISDIDQMLNKNRYKGKPLTLFQIQNLNEQKALYIKFINELTQKDSDRVKSEVDTANRIIAEERKKTNTIITAAEKAQQEETKIFEAGAQLRIKKAEEEARRREFFYAQSNRAKSVSQTYASSQSKKAPESVYRDLFDQAAQKEANNAIALSRTAKTVNELREAYKRLEQAKMNINPNTREGVVAMQKLERATDSVVKKLDAYKSKVNSSFKGSLNFADQAHSIKQLEQALRNLETAKRRINPDTKTGREQLDALNRKIDETKNKLDSVSGSVRKMKGAFGGLKGVISSAFGIQAIKQFVSNLIKVRGELELQHKSLQVLLSSKYEANVLWKQTTDLALKSPFMVKDIAIATKQLAAYRVESNKLHSTTRMLADISAGLGVEMSRLILAFGQVKAAGFLRGTEHRQFTEAGVNLLDELAEYYTNIEGKTVTVEEVFKRISERMVSFSDVEAVLKNITSEGGIFYQMQEQQAETLRGQISNLKDQIQLMLNDIGENNEGLIKGVISMISGMVSSWESIKPILITAGTLWGIYTLGVKTNTAALYSNLNAARRSATGMSVMRVALRGVDNGFRAAATSVKTFFASIGPIGWFIIALEAVASIFNSLSVDVSKANKEFERISKTSTAFAIKFNRELNKDNIKGMKKELVDLVDFAKRELNLEIELDPKLNTDKINKEEVIKKMAEVQEAINTQNALNRQFSIGIEGSNRHVLGIGDYEDDFAGYEEAANKEYSGLVATITKIWAELKSEQDKLLKSNSQVPDELAKSFAKFDSMLQQKGEDMVDHYHRIKGNVRDVMLEFKKLGLEEDANFDDMLGRDWRPWTAPARMWAKDVKDEFEQQFSRVDVSHIPIPDREMHLKAMINTTAAEREFGLFTTRLMTEWANTRFNVKIPFAPGKDGDDDENKDDNNNKPPVTGGGTPPKIKTWEQAIAAIKKYNDAYKDLLKNNDAVTAASKAWDYYGEEVQTAAKNAGLSIQTYLGEKAIKLTTEEGVTAALEALKKRTPYQDDKKKVGEIILGVRMDADDKSQDRAMEELKGEFEDLFAGYDVSVELDKLHVSPELAKGLFNVDIIGIDKLRSELEASKSEFEKLGENGVKEYNEYLTKIGDLETKAQQEQIKKYLGFARDAMGERAKIMLDSFYELQDITKAFTITESLAKDRELITDEQLENMRKAKKSIKDIEAAIKVVTSKDDERAMFSSKEISDSASLLEQFGIKGDQINQLKEAFKLMNEQRETAIEFSKQQSESKLQKMDWDMFRNSEMFQKLFSDLSKSSDVALEKLISQLKSYQDQWKDMPFDQAQQLIKLLEEAEAAQKALGSPSEVIESAKKDIKESGYSDSDTATNAMIDAETRLIALDEEFSVLEKIERLRAEGVSDAEIEVGLKKEHVDLLKTSKSDLEEEQNSLKKTVSNAKQYLDAVERIRAAYSEMQERLNKVKELVDKIFEGWNDVNELFEDDSISKSIADLAKGMSDIVFSAISTTYSFREAKAEIDAAGESADVFGAKINMALGIIGWIVLAIQLVTKLLKFAFDMHDNKLQKQIDATTESVEELELAYEKLKEAIEDAYSSAMVTDALEAANENLRTRISLTKELKALEEDKKKSDEEQIKQYDEEIRDLEAEIAENIENVFSKATDGILDNVLDASKDFVDAWYDAFEETGHGMSGLKDTFKEMLINMLKQQASMNVMGKYIDSYQNELKKYINAETGDTIFTTDEAEAFADYVKGTMGQANEELEGYFAAMSNVVDQFNTGELSGLQKGIQGITEDQAEVLASYWNSCRYLLANIDTTLTDVAARAFGEPGGSNSIIGELQRQTDILTNIYNQLSSVIGSGGNTTHAREYIRVLDA